MTKRDIFMTGGQFSLALTQIGWDVDTAAWKLGQNRRRIISWLKDEDFIPRWVMLFCVAMTVDEAREKVMLADQMMIDAKKAEARR